jgi:hypothetical protein
MVASGEVSHVSLLDISIQADVGYELGGEQSLILICSQEQEWH